MPKGLCRLCNWNCSWETTWLHLNYPIGQLFLATIDCRHLEGKICLWKDTCTILSGMSGAFFSYSSAYYNFSAKSLPQSTPANAYFCMFTVYNSCTDIPSNAHYTSLTIFFHGNRNKHCLRRWQRLFSWQLFIAKRCIRRSLDRLDIFRSWNHLFCSISLEMTAFWHLQVTVTMKNCQS